MLICVAGSGAGAFLGATTNANRATFIGNLVNFMPLARCRVRWTTNLAEGAWNTLTSNPSGTGGIMRVTDAGAAGSDAPLLPGADAPVRRLF